MKAIITVLTCVTLGIVTGCTSEPCGNQNCGSHGACVSVGEVSICECEPEWEQNANGKCEFFKLDNFPGQYLSKETCTNTLTNETTENNYTLTVSILSQLNREILLKKLNNQSCGAGGLEVEAVVSNTSFAFKVGDYCEQSSSKFLLTSGEGALEDDGTYSLSYQLQYYEFGTILRSETCQTTLTPQ